MGSTPTLSLSIPAGDYVNHMLLMVFGPIWTAIANSGLNTDSIGSASGGTFGPAFLIYNLAILTMTIFYIVKVIFEGVAGTANHGEWLGKQFSGYWTTLRIVAMLGLIAPVASGYSVSQIIVLWTGAQALGAADSIASTMLSTVIAQGGIAQPSPSPSARDIASDVLRADVCLLTLDNPMNSSGNIVVQSQFGSGGVSGIRFGGAPGSNIPPDACGLIAVSAGNPQILNAEFAAMNAMLPVLTPVAQEIVKNALSTPAQAAGNGSTTTGTSSGIAANQISIAAQKYSASMQSAAAAYLALNSQTTTGTWTEALNNDGFSALGAFMIDISIWDQQISNFAMAQPAVVPPSMSQLPSGYGLAAAESAADTYIGLANQQGATMALAGQVTNPIPAIGGGGILSRFVSPFLLSVNSRVQNGVAALSSSTVNPIGQIQTLGITIMSAGWTAYGVAVGASVLAGPVTGNEVDQVSGVAQGATFAMGLVHPLLLIMVAVPIILGGTLAYLLPALLFISMTMAVIGWVAAFIVATLGASLWASAHAVPDGEGFVPGAARQGYQLLMSLFAKPSLIVFGFFAALLMFGAGEYLINMLFTFASNSVLAGSLDGSFVQSFVAAIMSFIGFMAFIAIRVVMYYKLAEWSFGLVHLIPDNALSWIGFNDMSMQEERTHSDIYAAASSSQRVVQSGLMDDNPALSGPKRGKKQVTSDDTLPKSTPENTGDTGMA